MERTQVGIVAPALGMPEATVQRFIDSVHASKPSCSYKLRIAKGLGSSAGLSNISRARNIGIRSMLDDCEVVVCADSDLVVPEGLIDRSYKIALSHSNFWARAKEGGSIRLSARGTWNAMRWQEWVKSGGWDERCIGWGGEDDVFHSAIAERGIPTFREDGFDLMHPPHQPRSQFMSRRNLRIAKPTTWNWLAPNGAMTLFTTSRCTMECAECSVGPLRQRDKTYSMSMEDVCMFVCLTKQAGYRYRIVVLSGGEPCLWPHLYRACRLIKESGITKRIKILSNGSVPDAITSDLIEVVDEIVLSTHNSHMDAEMVAKKYPGTVRTVNRQDHYRIPQQAYPNTTPSDCVCGLNFFLYAGTVGLCPMELSVLVDHHPHIMPMRGRYLDELMSVDRYNQPACTACCANEKVRKLVGTVPAQA